MVLKSCKPGHSSLNTGRTIRRCPTQAARGRTYGYIQCAMQSPLGCSAAKSAATQLGHDIKLGALSADLSCDGVELSLNKKGRWNVADRIKSDLLPRARDADYQVTLYEHHNRYGVKGGSTCVGFYSSSGSVQEKISGRYMNARSVGKEEGQNRRERRLRRSQRQTGDAENHLNDDEASVKTATMHLSCDVVHSVPTGSSACYPAKELGHAERQKRSRGKNVHKSFLLSGTSGECWEEITAALDDEVDYEPSSLTDEASAAAEPLTRDAPVLFSLADIKSKGRERQSRRHLSFDSEGAHSSPLYVNTAFDLSCKKRRLEFVLNRTEWPLSSPQATDASGGVKTASSLLHGEQSQQLLRPAPVSTLVYFQHGCDLSEVTLAQHLGERYTECRCYPRTFTVQFSDVLNDVIAKHRRLGRVCNKRLSAVLVLRHLRDDINAYRVWLSTNFNMDTVRIDTLLEAKEYTLATLLDDVEAYLHAQPAESFITREPKEGACVVGKRLVTFDLLNSERHWSIACQTLHDAQSEMAGEVARLERENERNAKDMADNVVLIPAKVQRSLSTSLALCGICFEDVAKSSAAMALTDCQHWFCDACWRAHLCCKVGDSSLILQCMEYQCCTLVDNATLLALCGPDVAVRHSMHQAENMVWKNGDAMWCPNSYCSRLLRVKHAGKPDAAGTVCEPVCVDCACGKMICFQCLEEPHWPLTCAQAVTYRDHLRKLGLYTIAAKYAEITVCTKPCPSCRYPIEKAEGCNHMGCPRCSAHFCWRCLTILSMQEIYNHVNSCKLASVAVNEVEFTAASQWQTSSSLVKSAIGHRMYKCVATSKLLEKQAITTARRCKISTLRDFVRSSFGLSDAMQPNDAELLAAVERRLLVTTIAFKLQAHHVLEYSLMCLELPQLRSPPATRSTQRRLCIDLDHLRKHALVEAARLAFILECLDNLLLLLSKSDTPTPTAAQLRRVDSFASNGAQSLRRFVNIMASYQGF